MVPSVTEETVVKEFANKSYRTILVAQKSFLKSEWEQINQKTDSFETDEMKESVEQGLILTGIFGIMDPLRPGIRSSVE